MSIAEKLHQWKIEKYGGYTVFHDIFIPMIINDSDEVEKIMAGHLTLKSAVNEDELCILLSRIPQEYKGKMQWDAVRAGGFVNLADLLAKQISMYPFPFEKGKFSRISGRYKRLGDTALVILYPDIFLQRVRNALGLNYVNQYYAMFASVQYKGRELDPYTFNLFFRNASERWKQELLLTARMNPNISVISTESDKYMDSMHLEIGSIRDIAVICAIDDIVKGKLPNELCTPEYTGYLNSFKVSKKEIKQWVLNLSGNVMDIVPVKEWMDKLEMIFPKERWKAVTLIEKLFPDAASMPRLTYYEKSGRDRVFIHINRIEFQFYEYGADQKRLLRGLISFAEKECKTRFCHMSMETNADLGTIPDKRILSQEQFREERTTRRGDLFEHQCLEADYKLIPSPYAVEIARRDWHYSVSISTPNNEHTMWYDTDSVMEFFDEAEKSNLGRIDYLMKGNVHGRYQKIR